MYCNSRASVLWRLCDYLRLLMGRMLYIYIYMYIYIAVFMVFVTCVQTADGAGCCPGGLEGSIANGLWQTDRLTDWQTDRLTECFLVLQFAANKEKDKHTIRQTNKQTERQADKKGQVFNVSQKEFKIYNAINSFTTGGGGCFKKNLHAYTTGNSVTRENFFLDILFPRTLETN